MIERAKALLGDKYDLVFNLALEQIRSGIEQDLGEFGVHFNNWYSEKGLLESGAIEDAIKVSTLNGAKYLRLDQEIGSILKGKKADLVVIGGDPTQNVQDLRKVELVFKDGVGFDSQKVFEFTKGSVGVH